MITSRYRIALLAAFLGLQFNTIAQTTADSPDCLVFRAAPVGNDSMLKGTLTNECGRVVTAYALSATVGYSDGKVSALSGMGEDLLLGAAGASAGPTPGIGPIQPGEVRAVPAYGVAARGSQATVVTAVARVSSVIFDDASAVGDDARIEQFFSSRRGDLREQRFWQESLAKFKSKISKEEGLARIADLANIPEREQRLRVPNEWNWVQSNADMIKSQLRVLDGMVASGQMTREQAIQLVEKLIAAHVANFEQNANRRK